MPTVKKQKMAMDLNHVDCIMNNEVFLALGGLKVQKAYKTTENLPSILDKDQDILLTSRSAIDETLNIKEGFAFTVERAATSSSSSSSFSLY